MYDTFASTGTPNVVSSQFEEVEFWIEWSCTLQMSSYCCTNTQIPSNLPGLSFLGVLILNFYR